MHVFKNSPNAPAFDSNFELMMMEMLGEYNVEDFRSNGGDGQGDKIRITFKIKDP